MKERIFPLMILLLAILAFLTITSGITGFFVYREAPQEPDQDIQEWVPSVLDQEGDPRPKTDNPEGDAYTWPDSPQSQSPSGGGGGGGGDAPQPPESPPEDPGQDHNLYFSPSLVRTSAGAVFCLEIRATGQDIFAVSFRMHYDPETLFLRDYYEGDFLKQGGVSTHGIITDDPDGGIINYDATRLGVQYGASGDGELLIVTFDALKAGTATLTLGDVRLIDSSLNDIPATAGECAISID